MRHVIIVLAFLLPTHAWAQTQPSSTRITNSNGSVAAAVQSTATAGTEAGLVVRVAGSVAVTGSISATNPSVAAVAGAVPASATQIGGNDGSGNLAVPQVLTSAPVGAEPGLVVRIAGGSSGSNASVGTNGAAAPTSSTQLGLKDATSGNLEPVAGIDVDPGAGVVTAQAVLITGTGSSSILGIVSERNGTLDNGGVAPMLEDSTGTARVPRVYDTNSGVGTEHTQGVVLRSSASGGSAEIPASTTTPATTDLGLNVRSPLENAMGLSNNATSFPTHSVLIAGQGGGGATEMYSPIVRDSPPVGSEYGMVVRPALSYNAGSAGIFTQRVVIANDQTAIPVNTSDGAGNLLESTTATPTSSARGLVVREAPGASIVAGQQAVTGTATALPSVAVRQVCVTHVEGGSVGTVYVGPTGVTTSTGWPLTPGAGVCLPTDSVADVFVIASGVGSSIAYVGVP